MQLWDIQQRKKFSFKSEQDLHQTNSLPHPTELVYWSRRRHDPAVFLLCQTSPLLDYLLNQGSAGEESPETLGASYGLPCLPAILPSELLHVDELISAVSEMPKIQKHL